MNSNMYFLKIWNQRHLKILITHNTFLVQMMIHMMICSKALICSPEIILTIKSALTIISFSSFFCNAVLCLQIAQTEVRTT